MSVRLVGVCIWNEWILHVVDVDCEVEKWIVCLDESLRLIHEDSGTGVARTWDDCGATSGGCGDCGRMTGGGGAGEDGWRLIGFLKLSKSVGHLFFEVITKLRDHLAWIKRSWSGAGPFRWSLWLWGLG